jgi:hypothetical protein
VCVNLKLGCLVNITFTNTCTHQSLKNIYIPNIFEDPKHRLNLTNLSFCMASQEGKAKEFPGKSNHRELNEEPGG